MRNGNGRFTPQEVRNLASWGVTPLPDELPLGPEIQARRWPSASEQLDRAIAAQNSLKGLYDTMLERARQTQNRPRE